MGGGEKEENVQGKLIRTELIFEFFFWLMSPAGADLILISYVL